MFMIINLGSTFVFIVLILVLLVFQLILQGLSVLFPIFEKPLAKLHAKLYWNFYMRFLIQQFQPLLITSLINLYKMETSTLVKFSSLVLALTAPAVLAIGIFA